MCHLTVLLRSSIIATYLCILPSIHFQIYSVTFLRAYLHLILHLNLRDWCTYYTVLPVYNGVFS